jgi:hypothetical protein
MGSWIEANHDFPNRPAAEQNTKAWSDVLASSEWQLIRLLKESDDTY